MAKTLVIESPTKADAGAIPRRSIYREVEFGHVRDLPDSASEVPEGQEEKWGRSASTPTATACCGAGRQAKNGRICGRTEGHPK
jgi:hypothetical protein